MARSPRLDDGLADFGRGVFTASPELQSAYEDKRIIVKNQEEPLEKDSSIMTAYQLAEEEIWSFGIDAFPDRLQDVPGRSRLRDSAA